MRESGRLKRLRGHAAADLGLHRRPDRQRLRRLVADGRDRDRCSADFLYEVPIPTETIPALLVTLLVGTFAFCSLGLALSIAIPSEEAAPPITNFTVLPLYFLSGVFVPESEIPDGVLAFASLFPIRPFFQAFLTAYDPPTDRGRLRLGAPRGRRRLGGRRNPPDDAVLPLVAGQRVSPVGASVVATGAGSRAPA